MAAKREAANRTSRRTGFSIVLREKNTVVRGEAAWALGEIGAAAESVVPALIQALGDAEEFVREKASAALAKIGRVAVPSLIDATRRLASVKHQAAVMQVLLEIDANSVVNANSAGEEANADLSDEDQQTLDLFADVNPKRFLSLLQTYWCIGLVERDVMESANLAKGYAKLHEKLELLEAKFDSTPVNVSIGYIRETCLEKLAELFSCKPFSNIWSAEEVNPDLRIEERVGNRIHGRWTPRARKAWSYVNRFLTLRGWLPEIKRFDG